MDIKSPWSKAAWSSIPYEGAESPNGLPEAIVAFYEIADEIEERLNQLEDMVEELHTIEPMGDGDTEISEALQAMQDFINQSQERLRQALHVLGDLEPLAEGDIETFSQMRNLRMHAVTYEY